jgi:lipid A 3-O-deacylase
MRGRASAGFLVALLLGSTVARADDLWMRDDARWLVVLGGGAFDLNLPSESEDTEPLYEIELRMKPGFYGGVHLDLPIGDHFRVVPSGSIGAYDKGGNGKNLGGTLEFRIGGGIAWRFDNDWRVAVNWYHMSNADTGDTNPGAEMMMLEVGIPLP